MNDAEKLDAILTAVQTPAAATVDPTVLANAISAALAPITTQLTAMAAQLTDIQGEVDEPAAQASTTSPATPATPTTAS